MSAFVAPTGGDNRLTILQDLRLNHMQYREMDALFAECISAIAPGSFETEFWPLGGGFLGDSSVDYGLLEASWWGEYDPASGAESRYGFTGVTRDVLGSAVGSVTVKLFRTSDDQLLHTVVSDSGGNFLLATAYYPDAHYIVAHKTASPNIDGVTTNTLIGS